MYKTYNKLLGMYRAGGGRKVCVCVWGGGVQMSIFLILYPTGLLYKENALH